MNTYTVQIHFNETPEHRFSGFEHGDTLVPSKLEPFRLASPSPESVAEDVFALFNRDDRANGSFERSVSVGDVIQLTQELPTGEIHIWMAVEGSGFRQVDGPVLETV